MITLFMETGKKVSFTFDSGKHFSILPVIQGINFSFNFIFERYCLYRRLPKIGDKLTI